MNEFTEKIPQHKHCHLCGKAFVGTGQFCSKECLESEGKDVKKKLKKYAIVMGVIWVITIVVIVMYLQI